MLCFYYPNTISEGIVDWPGKPGILYVLNDIKKSSKNIVALYQSNNNPRDRAEQLEKRTRGAECSIFIREIQI